MSEPIRKTHCRDCGMLCELGLAEYHPHSFCILKCAGYDPWKTYNDFLEAAGHDRIKPFTVQVARMRKERSGA